MLATLVLLLSLVPSTLAWGTSGHIASARLAQSLFTSAATNVSYELLPDVSGQIAAISSWADQVRSQPAYRWSAGLHFADTPDFVCNYDVTRDCSYNGVDGVCVDGAVRNYTKRLQDNSIASMQQYREALEFLVHFVGDLHQVTLTQHTLTRTYHP